MNEKYCDLLIEYDGGSVKVHKYIICEKSPFIKRLINDENWPPIHTIKIPGFNNVFEKAMSYIYDEKIEEVSIELIKMLSVLEINYIPLLKKYLPTEKLTLEQIDLLKYLIERNPNNNLLNFYGEELGSKCNDLYYKSEKLEVIGKEHKWFHFDSFPPDTDIEINCFNINWTVSRFLHCFGFNECEDFIKIYARDSKESDKEISIRATFILYFINNKPIKRRSSQLNIVPSKFTPYYMKTNFISNKLGITIDHYKEKKLRVSLLMESI